MQVYQPTEEELRSYLDPYENIICSECHQGEDDGLMLLCDLCDSSAHTYCVGLGRKFLKETGTVKFVDLLHLDQLVPKRILHPSNKGSVAF